jgi:UDP-hydrolysing UDP-N-acetyl-D-glucosamine 2-epimerase
MPRERRVCFVTGTRAEFGLMASTLRAIQGHPNLKLQVVVTGMHLSRARGDSRRAIAAEGWTIDRVVPWPDEAGDSVSTAQHTGAAMAQLARVFDDLQSDVILVVGDRVEAFAAAAAGRLSGRVVAHVHGGDRAQGQVDDSLRHAISKLAHVHFAATSQSAQRLVKLGEDRWRVHRVGAPGIDGIETLAAKKRSRDKYALLVLHPADPDERLEHRRAGLILRAIESAGFDRIVIVYPNNDPGSEGIVRRWDQASHDERTIVHKNLSRPEFLGLLRDAAVLVGNSSSGIIEAASFGTPVIDVGPRQRGRQRSQNVTNVPYGKAAIGRALARIWNNGRPKRFPKRNVYGGAGVGRRIATILARLSIDDRTRRKLITY